MLLDLGKFRSDSWYGISSIRTFSRKPTTLSRTPEQPWHYTKNTWNSQNKAYSRRFSRISTTKEERITGSPSLDSFQRPGLDLPALRALELARQEHHPLSRTPLSRICLDPQLPLSRQILHPRMELRTLGQY